MKVLLAAVALLAAIEAEAHPGWGFSPDVQNGRRNNLGRGPPWGYPQRPQQMQNQNNGAFDADDVEWVCQNPKTNDIMIIASDDTQHHPGEGQWHQWQNVPPGHKHHHHGNHWTQPIIIVQESDNNETPTSFPTTSEIPNNNNNNNDKQTQPPPYHGGEGSIDIRLGAE